MWISYSDSEVNKFHPICEKALKMALDGVGLQKKYEVIHHAHTGSLEMDFAIFNKKTGKVLCVIEVKRTPTDVHSARYQYQAMSYVQMNDGQTEEPFYILTNLEYAFTFRYDSRRPRVFQQMLSPGLSSIGLFKDYPSEEEFVKKLSLFFENRIIWFTNNRYSYLVTLDQFAEHMNRLLDNPRKWKSNLVIMLYEYIRGAFTVVSRSDLHDVRLFQNDIVKICNEAAHINFQEIFGYTPDLFEDTAFVGNGMLINLFDFAHQSVSGDAVADVLHQIVSAGHEHEGEVPTDLELGRILALLAHHVCGQFNNNDIICDPAAGSGNLISSAIPEFNLLPRQIIANDVNKQLGELLTLRLGLNFTSIVGKENVPLVTCRDICDLSQEYFKKVKALVMNPPFVSGIYSVERKKRLFARIKEIKGLTPKTSVGQMPLEAVFLELITCLVPSNTTIACIFPKTHLSARGAEAQAIRKFLLEEFGLRMIFNYPGKGIFEDVTRDTCILIGVLNKSVDKVSVISSYDIIPNIDLMAFKEALSTELETIFKQITPGIVAKYTEKQELVKDIADGWRAINSEMLEAINFVGDNIQLSQKFRLFSESNFKMKRGGAGNSGGSDLIFFDSRKELYDQFADKRLPLMPGMRNAELDYLVANNGDSEFLDSNKLDKAALEDIVAFYLKLPSKNGSQAKIAKTKEKWISILEKESKGCFQPNSVLIPRALRKNGKVYVAFNEIFVSTNFLVCYGLEMRQAILLATWISTIFYQLICEVSSKNQEGLRKMEINDIMLTFIPKFECVSEETYKKLELNINYIQFLDLQKPEIRKVDEIWANELFGKFANEKLLQAEKLLAYLGIKRNL